MFPPSLHKNIRELDKQISLLESECEHMESEKRKKPANSRICLSKFKEQAGYVKRNSVSDDGTRPFMTIPRFAEAGTPKKTLKQSQKRPKSVQILKDNPSKSTARKDVSTVTCDELKNKHFVRICSACGRVRERTRPGTRRDERTQNIKKCSCDKESLNDSVKDVGSIEPDINHNKYENENHILHRGILHANPGAAIEVTVTQKSLKPSRHSSKALPSASQGANVVLDKIDSESCILKEKKVTSNDNFPQKKSQQGPKWSEILSQGSDSTLNKKNQKTRSKIDHTSNQSLNTECLSPVQSEKFEFEEDANMQDPNLMKLHKLNAKPESQLWNNENREPESAFSLSSKKSRHTTPCHKKNLENAIDISPRTLRGFEKRKTNDECEKSEMSEESFDPMRILNDLMDALKGNPNEHVYRQLLNDLKSSIQEYNDDVDAAKRLARDKVDDDYELCINQDNDYVKKLRKHFWSTKKLCDKLMKEKHQLSEDLAVKERMLSDLSSKEKDYLTMITNLKQNVEKNKSQAEDNAEALKELNVIKNKLDSETKVVDALRKSHAKMQEQIHKCMLENDKLKTEIRLNKLESQKYCVLLAGKDAEIKRYRNEVESFQRHITDQLTALRSNNPAGEVQKAMEAILHHSQSISTTDLDSAFSDVRSDRAVRSSSKTPGLIHSSPTSTKSSGLDSSWNHISSIHDEDGKSEPEEILVGEMKQSRLHEENDRSFVSCKSADELSMTGLLSRLDEADAPKNFSITKPAAFSGNLRRNIEDLFREIKEQCSRKLLSSDSFRFDELLNGSQTSDFTELSGSLLEAVRKT